MFASNDNGQFKRLDDGRALYLAPQIFNTEIRLSSSPDDPGWSEGWVYSRTAKAVEDWVV